MLLDVSVTVTFTVSLIVWVVMRNVVLRLEFSQLGFVTMTPRVVLFEHYSKPYV